MAESCASCPSCQKEYNIVFSLRSLRLCASLFFPCLGLAGAEASATGGFDFLEAVVRYCRRRLGLPQRNSAMSVTLQLDLPDALVHEARSSGLLESQRIGEMLNEELRRERARKDLGRMLEELHSLPGEPMTYEEIQAEIDAVRAERRQRESSR
jgi:hypothetical protein